MLSFAIRPTNVLLSPAVRDVAAHAHIEYLLPACVIDVAYV